MRQFHFTIQVFCLVTIVSSSITLHYIRNVAPSTVLLVTNVQIRDRLGKSYSELIVSSVAAVGLGIGAAIATMLIEIVIISLRFINFGIVTYKIKLFLAVVSL